VSGGLKKFLMHYVLYGLLLLTLCLGIFPFIILYSSSMSVAELLDRLVPGRSFAKRTDDVWTLIGKPYDYLVQAAG
jgi:hypothetical protein